MARNLFSPNPDRPVLTNREQCQQMLQRFEKAKQAKIRRGGETETVDILINKWLEAFEMHTKAGTLDDEFIPVL